MRTLAHALLLLAALVSPAQSQQYDGDEVPLPKQLHHVAGAEIAFFRIADPTGQSGGLTLTNYYSLQDDDKTRIDPAAVQRALIIIHGWWRDPAEYMQHILAGLRVVATGVDANINRSSVAVLAPFFANHRDHNPVFQNTSALFWRGSKWSAGADNQRPRRARNAVSSFEVLDQLVGFFADTGRFPQLKQIVVAGHSLGAQAVARYAQIGNDLPSHRPPSSSSSSSLSSAAPAQQAPPLSYVIANPNSWAWMNTTRPQPIPDHCTHYDAWRAGFARFAEYPMQYGRDYVARGGREAVLARWHARSKALLFGLGDHDDTRPDDCVPHTTGADHIARALAFLDWYRPRCPAPHDTAAGQCDTVDYVDTGHNVSAMWGSAAGQARLFRDNFYGDGARDRDHGPRQQPGDDPFPSRTS